MKAPARNRSCPRCGGASTVELDGLCPGCVARLAFETQADALATGALPVHDLCVDGMRQFGDYELIQEIARGGMGVVYKARQLSLNRFVAVKLILTGRLASPTDVQRFRAEAEAAANLQHPNIVAIHEVGRQDGHDFFSMDYIEGSSLAAVISSGPVPPVRAAGWVKTIAEAIHYAHQRGILHRDLKPSNILIDGSDRPRITDFGLAKQLRRDSDLTVTGQVIGTPGFMSPEQSGARHRDLGPATDIYSLGALLYFLLAARPPFIAETLQEILAKVLNQEPTRLRAIIPGLPQDLETICLKCLEKDPRRRYASAQELAGDLARFLQDEPIIARRVTPPEKLWRWCRRRPAIPALILSLLVAAGSITALFIAWRFSSARPGQIASRRSNHFDGPVPTLLAFDGTTLEATSIGPAMGASVDAKDDSFWAATLFGGGVVVGSGAKSKILAQIPLGDCPGTVALDSVHRVVWVDAQCGKSPGHPSDDMLFVLDADTHEVITSFGCGGINGNPLAVNPNTGRFYHDVSGSIYALSYTNFTQRRTPFGGVVGVNRNSNFLYACGPNRTLQIVDGGRDAEEILMTLTLPFPVQNNSIGVDPMLNRIYVSDYYSNKILILDGASGQILGTLLLSGASPPVQGTRSVAFDETRKILYAIAWCGGHSYWLYQVHGEIQKAVSLQAEAGGPVINPGANKVYCWLWR